MQGTGRSSEPHGQSRTQTVDTYPRASRPCSRPSSHAHAYDVPMAPAVAGQPCRIQAGQPWAQGAYWRLLASPGACWRLLAPAGLFAGRRTSCSGHLGHRRRQEAAQERTRAEDAVQQAASRERERERGRDTTLRALSGCGTRRPVSRRHYRQTHRHRHPPTEHGHCSLARPDKGETRALRCRCRAPFFARPPPPCPEQNPTTAHAYSARILRVVQQAPPC